MKIAVASGKGGTGKTTLSVNLALSLNRRCCLLDCDVEEPNAHIFLKPKFLREEKCNVLIPEIDFKKCVWCGKCAEVCAYNAIVIVPPSGKNEGTGFVFEHLCHSCGACEYFCPIISSKEASSATEINKEIKPRRLAKSISERGSNQCSGSAKAISEKKKEIGKIEFGRKGKVDLITGRLNVGEIRAVPLIEKVKKNISLNLDAIIDAPPGTSCPMVEAVKGADYVILVTEPTPFGLNDLVLAVEVLRKLSIPFGVVVNRYDYGDDRTLKYCARENIKVLAKIPFKRKFAEAYSKGIPLVEEFPECSRLFSDIFKRIESEMFS